MVWEDIYGEEEGDVKKGGWTGGRRKGKGLIRFLSGTVRRKPWRKMGKRRVERR